MRQRYIARLAKEPSDHVAAAAFRDRLTTRERPAGKVKLDHRCEWHGAIVASSRPMLPLTEEHGVILGTLFERPSAAAAKALTPLRQARILVSRGLDIIETCWGPYVAIIGRRASPRIDVIRAPMGDLPCHIVETESAVFVASDIELLAQLAGYRPAIAWDEVIRLLAHPDIHRAATCLIGLSDLPGGDRLTLEQGNMRRETLWSPWIFAQEQTQIRVPAEAAALLRETAMECLNARAAQFESVLLTLSGGLDSSLVAACLSRQRTPFQGLNLVTHDPNGDERRHAARVGAVLGMPLTTAMRDVSKIDVHHSAARHLPRPSIRCFFQESLRLARATATQADAGAIFNGSGGDNVFCSLQSGAPAADRLLAEGFGKGFLQSAYAMSEFAPASLWEVMRDAIRRAWLGKPAFRIRPELQFLSPEACALATDMPLHPWLTPPRGIPPGKAMHVRLVAVARSYVESLDPLSALPVVAPLLSQPLVEVCLRIPSWLWFESGHNRMVARRAFTDVLPPDILLRRSKGTPDSFIVQIMEVHGKAIRAMLLEGELARRGLIDLPAVLQDLDAPGPRRNKSFERILHLVDVEAWARDGPGSGD